MGSSVGKLLLTTIEAAELLRVAAGTLENWRSEGVGPPFVRYTARGPRGSVLYRVSDIQKWIDNQLIDPGA